MGNREDELTKDVGCVPCKRVLDPTCKGHLKGHTCLNFEEREDRKHGREKSNREKTPIRGFETR